MFVSILMLSFSLRIKTQYAGRCAVVYFDKFDSTHKLFASMHTDLKKHCLCIQKFGLKTLREESNGVDGRII
jgi:hypothetical protein